MTVSLALLEVNIRSECALSGKPRRDKSQYEIALQTSHSRSEGSVEGNASSVDVLPTRGNKKGSNQWNETTGIQPCIPGDGITKRAWLGYSLEEIATLRLCFKWHAAVSMISDGGDGPWNVKGGRETPSSLELHSRSLFGWTEVASSLKNAV